MSTKYTMLNNTERTRDADEQNEQLACRLTQLQLELSKQKKDEDMGKEKNSGSRNDSYTTSGKLS